MKTQILPIEEPTRQAVREGRSLLAARQPAARLLVGTPYPMLRRDFLRWKEWEREFPAVARKVLVTLGGGDTENLTLKVIEALRHSNTGIEGTVVAGSASPHFEALQQAVKESGACIRLMHNAEDMPQLMAWADVPVAAAGSTSWELAFLGVPRLALILSDHQRLVAEGLAQAGAAENLGSGNSIPPNSIAVALERLLSDASTRAHMAARVRQLVDGEGTERVLMHLQGKALRLRPVEARDCRMVWEWANDPEVRANSFRSAAIPWSDHEKWFRGKLANPKCHAYIGFDEIDRAVGQVRFDVNEQQEAVAAISIIRSLRGKGYGQMLLEMATKQLFSRSVVGAIHAFVKPVNLPSARIFEKAAFGLVNGIEKVEGNTALHFVRVRGNGD